MTTEHRIKRWVPPEEAKLMKVIKLTLSIANRTGHGSKRQLEVSNVSLNPWALLRPICSQNNYFSNSLYRASQKCLHISQQGYCFLNFVVFTAKHNT